MDMDDMILVSVDDHVVEPADAFVKHFPKALMDRAPVNKRIDGKDVWLFEGSRYPGIGINSVVGRPRSEYGMEPSSYDQMRKGCYSPKERVDDMNANGVLGSLCFPSFPLFAGSVFAALEDKALALASVRAYNDWHVYDWCGHAPGRFIPMILLPLWDVDASVAEIQRMSALGVHAVSFPDNPVALGLPSLHDPVWNPLWSALSDHAMVINCHIGSGTLVPHASPDTPIDAWIITMPMSICFAAADWLNAPFWKDYPNLKMALSEGGIGWIPYFLERADFTYTHHREWTHSNYGGQKPSEQFRKHILTCFIDDQFGLENLHHIGEDSVMWECDYPHSDTLWPECPEGLWPSLKHLPESTINKITHLNAMREFNYDPFSILGRENCTVGALRAQAKDVDISVKSGLGGLSTKSMNQDGEERRPVTSREIIEMFGSA